MKYIIAIKSFFWNGILIKKDEIIFADKTAIKQLVEEDGLCKLHEGQQ